MNIQEPISLKPYHTFGIDVWAKKMATFKSVSDLQQLLEQNRSEPNKLIIGGGSNILFTKNYDGLILKNEVVGIVKLNEDDEFVYIKAGAGENWHRFVMYCIDNNWFGAENLALIPGCVGASPMQNIGAYGVELKDIFYELQAFHLHEKTNYVFKNKDCHFGYRESIFKRKYKDEFVIMNVTFRLRKQPVFHTHYGAIEQELKAMNVLELSSQAIAQAVINIRTSKLPDPTQIGNAGSFFKNPLVSSSQYEALRQVYPEIAAYKNEDGTVKLAAGWLIEQCGWKGYRNGDTGVHEKQALVLVNYANATGDEILQLSESIIKTVADKFAVSLEREVNIV